MNALACVHQPSCIKQQLHAARIALAQVGNWQLCYVRSLKVLSESCNGYTSTRECRMSAGALKQAVSHGIRRADQPCPVLDATCKSSSKASTYLLGTVTGGLLCRIVRPSNLAGAAVAAEEAPFLRSLEAWALALRPLTAAATGCWPLRAGAVAALAPEELRVIIGWPERAGSAPVGTAAAMEDPRVTMGWPDTACKAPAAGA